MSKRNSKRATTIMVNSPATIRFDLVPADALKQYELHQWLFSTTSTFAIGFWVSFFTASTSYALLGSAVAFTLFTILYLYLIIKTRRRMYAEQVTRTSTLDNFN